MTHVQGPFTLCINEETGLLVDGFDTPPMILMGHDPVYAAVRLVAGRVPRWRQRWQTGAFAAAAATGRQLDQLADGDAGYLAAGVLRQIARPAGPAGYGMCGLLTRYDPATAATSR